MLLFLTCHLSYTSLFTDLSKATSLLIFLCRMVSLFPLLSHMPNTSHTLSITPIDSPLRQQSHQGEWTVSKGQGSLCHSLLITLLAYLSCQNWTEGMQPPSISDLPKGKPKTARQPISSCKISVLFHRRPWGIGSYMSSVFHSQPYRITQKLTVRLLWQQPETACWQWEPWMRMTQ